MRIVSSSPLWTAFAAVLVLLATGAPALGFGGGDAAPPASHDAGALAVDAEVLETMDADDYTYLRVRASDGEVWAAGPHTEVAVGDRVNLQSGLPMKDFHSATLDRTFEMIYFLDAIKVVGRDEDAAVASAVEAAHRGSTTTARVDVGEIGKAEGGSTIAELFAGRKGFAGKQVLVRGQVVKFNPEIMGRNWIHIQDGSGEAGSNDLTVTTDAYVELGDVILVRGTAVTDKDFGSGYRYDLIIEEASIEVE